MECSIQRGIFYQMLLLLVTPHKDRPIKICKFLFPMIHGPDQYAIKKTALRLVC